MLTLDEKVYLIQCYGIGERSINMVIALFNEKYPNTAINKATAWRLIKRFLTTGSVHYKKREKKAYDETDAGTLVALNSVDAYPKMSLRNRSVNTNISKTHLQRIYKANKIYPYKAKFCHTLEEGDEARRLQFCLSLGELILENRNFHKLIIFSDECTFTTNGVPSSQNCRYWSRGNPHYVVNSRRQYFGKLNVWCAVSYELGIIGPFVIEGRLNQQTYLQILQRFVDELPLNIRRSHYFQQDGCPAHSTQMITDWLNNQFVERWFGRMSVTSWPARSPDLSIMDFFVWGWVKQIVYQEHIPNDTEILKRRITAAVLSIPIEQIQAAFGEFRNRIENCANLGGGLVEAYF